MSDWLHGSISANNGLTKNITEGITETDVIVTAALASRPARQPDLVTENKALRKIAHHWMDAPQSILKTIVRTTLELCLADTVGVSLLESAPDGNSVFRWVAIAGALEQLEQTTTPGNFSACGTTVACKQPQLYAYPERYFTYLGHPQLPIVEQLLIPLWVNERALGTLWIVSHNQARRFDNEDRRLMMSIGDFTASALDRMQVLPPSSVTIGEQSENYNQQIIDSSDGCIKVLDLEGRILFMSRPGQALLNIQDITPLLNTSWIEFWQGEERQAASEALTRAKAGEVCTFVGYRATFTGEPKWWDSKISPIRGRNGQVERLVCISRDITERRRSEEKRQQMESALRESEERLSAIFSQAAVGLCEMALDGNFQRVNDELCRMLGRAPEEVLAAGISNVTHPDDVAKSLEAFKTVVETGEAISLDKRYLRSDGTSVWANSSLTRLKDEQGRSLRVLAVIADLSVRKQVEEVVRRAAEFNEFRVSLSDALRPLADPVEIQATASRVLGEYLGANRVAYFEMRGADYVVERDYVNGAKAIAGSYPIDSFGPKLLTANRTGRAMSTSDVEADPNLSPVEKAAYAAIEIGSYISIPLVKGGEFIAGLAVHTAGARDWTADEVALAEEVAERTWAAVERVRAELALRQSEQRFRLMADAVPQIVWLTDAQGRVEFFNKQWSDYTGVPYEPTTAAKVAASFVHPDDGERTMAAFNQARQSGGVFSVEHRIRSATGTYRWFLVRAQPYRDPQTGEIIRWFGASVDIHDRKQAEATLREREQRLTIATEAAQLGVFEWKVSEDITVWENERLYEIFGLTPADGSVSSQEFFQRYLHPDDAEALSANMTKAMQTGSLRQTSYRICRQDGTIRWLEVNGQFEFAADGSPLRFVGVNADITERKQAEATIVQREAQFRQLADAMPQQVWITDAQGNTQYVNQQWTTYTGLTLEQTQNIHYVNQVIHPDDFEITSELLTTALATGTPYQAEFRLKHQVDGTYRWFLARAIAIRNEQGQIVQWFGTSTDIEEFRRAQAEREQLLAREQSARETAEQANRLKDEFLAVLSHELRSPLNPILGWSTMLQSKKLDAVKTAYALATIQRNAKLQSELIEDLLDVSRILRGKLSLNVAPANLVAIIRAAMETVQLAAQAKSIQVKASLAENVGLVAGDAMRLQQVIWNLLSNAVKFTPVGGEVNIRLERLDRYAQITVSDTGQGISSDFLPYVFDYFRQADGATTRKFGGLGLGLAIVQHLVELHGGTVVAESPGEGKGATFVVQIPLMAISSPSHLDENSPQQFVDLKGIKILVVDDETDTRELVTFILEEQGAKVTAAASAQEALVALTEFKPDMLLSDIGMPQMDGYMLIQQVRALASEQGEQIPAIALTAYAGEMNQQQAFAAGFRKHISKPIEPEELVQAIADLVRPT